MTWEEEEEEDLFIFAIEQDRLCLYIFNTTVDIIILY